MVSFTSEDKYAMNEGWRNEQLTNEQIFNGQEDPENPVWKKVCYIFLFLKVSQCKFEQKQTILKLRNPLKSK